VDRSLLAVIGGTFTLRFSTALTGALLGFYLANLHRFPGGEPVSPLTVGVLHALFYTAELVMSPFFGVLADRWSYRRVMQFGPLFGAVAVVLTGITTNIPLLGATRVLEGASTAASVPSLLGFLAIVTANDEQLRGRAVARFEAATLAGLGVGIVAAGLLWGLLGPAAFFLNAVLYMVSLAIYRYGVVDPKATEVASTSQQRGARADSHTGWRRYLRVLTHSHVWLLAPTWIAINASIGVWFSQSIFQFARSDPRFPDQLLMRGFTNVEISLAAAAIFGVFTGGLFYWGDRFKRYRRTTIIFYGILGGALLVASGVMLNHSDGYAIAVRLLLLVPAVLGLFVLAGATPAALGLLADTSEAYPNDRGAIMGLYSVFLALGQIGGSLIGAWANELRGVDGLLLATLGLLAVALLPLSQLRAFEHHFVPAPGGPQPPPDALVEPASE
jgi:MFS family permease